MDYVALIEKRGDLHIGTIPDIPGCVAVAPTYAETQRKLQNAITVHNDRLKSYGSLEPQRHKACTISILTR